jgi:hypothetical protein
MPDATPPAKPRSRRERVVAQPFGDDLLLYDLDSNRAHCLNAPAAFVWNACDGTQNERDLSVALSERFGLPQDSRVLLSTLQALDDAGLMLTACTKVTVAARHKPRAQSRRQALRALCAGALLVPSVLSITAPTAAQLLSCAGFGQPALPGLPCCLGLTPTPPLGLCL